MKKIILAGLASVSILTACSSPDPILPGTRSSVFPENPVLVHGTSVPNLPENIDIFAEKCEFTRDASNTIWHRDKKIFSGFATPNSVKTFAEPICNGKFVYAGLSTGELVCVNSKNQNIVWIADIYRDSNLTGGAGLLDIVSPIVLDSGYVYAAGLGDAFCKLNADSGKKIWCIEIASDNAFIIHDKLAFIVSTDNKLYAINTNSGDAYWMANLKKHAAPVYKNKTIIVGDQVFNASDGTLIK